MTQSAPVIGLTLDHEPAGGWSQYPWYAIRENYCAAVIRAGGLAVALPHAPEQAEGCADLLDGLVVTGGAFDVDPALFGAETRHATVGLKARRTAFELALTRAVLARDKPLLGICGGEQLINVALGVQRHPELEIDPGDRALFRAFVAACRGEEIAGAARAVR